METGEENPEFKKVNVYDRDQDSGMVYLNTDAFDEDTLLVKPDYDPEVNDELLTGAGHITPENILVLVTVSVPSDLTKMSVNLQGPFIINVEEHKACQVIVENGRYPVKYPIYEALKAGKAGE